MLVLWGIAALMLDGSDLVWAYRLFVGIIPGAYLVAGLLAPPSPFLTGLSLALVHLGVAAVVLVLQALTQEPPEPGGFDLGGLIVGMFLVGLVAGVVVTGVVGHISGWVSRRSWGRR